MDIESLKAKQADVNTRFENLGEQIQQHNEERLRLSGEFRALEGLVKELVEKTPQQAPDPAKTIVAEPKETKDGK